MIPCSSAFQNNEEPSIFWQDYRKQSTAERTENAVLAIGLALLFLAFTIGCSWAFRSSEGPSGSYGLPAVGPSDQALQIPNANNLNDGI